MQAPDARRLGATVLTGFAVAGGAPLAVVAVSLVGVAAVPPRLLVATTALGLLMFCVPLAVWLGYARTVASGGGLYAYVREAAGERAARWQGWIWSVAYVLYLPYTVVYIVDDLLPSVLPVRGALAAGLEVALAAGLCAAAAFAGGGLPRVLTLLAGAEVVTVAAWAALVLGGSHGGPVVAVPLTAADWSRVAAGGAQVSQLLVCSSLVTFLGGEARDAGAVRRSLLLAFAVLAGSVFVGALVLAAGAAPGGDSALPGASLAGRYGGAAAALALAFAALAAVAGLIVAEFAALVRLWRAMFALPEGKGTAVVSALFLAGTVASLAGPQRFYSLTLPPSLMALFASQAIVFATYPLLPHTTRGSAIRAWALALLACAWAVYGLVGAVRGSGLLGYG
ncbi:MAG: hypothetical protein K6V73_02680 [Firmicutes bacterium]|nr:hypothetical protein [Bacillota bacterium]